MAKKRSANCPIEGEGFFAAEGDEDITSDFLTVYAVNKQFSFHLLTRFMTSMQRRIIFFESFLLFDRFLSDRY